MNTYQRFLDGQIKLEKINSLEFVQLITEWKQDLYRMGYKSVNQIVVNTLKSCLESATNENERENYITYLRSVQ